MGNTVQKASNINQFKKLVFDTNSLINSRNKQDYNNSSIYITLSIDIPDNEIVTETILWKLLVNVLILVYNKTKDGNYTNEKPILRCKLSFSEFYSFLSAIKGYFEKENNKQSMTASATATANLTTTEKEILKQQEEDDKLCPICLDNEATNVSSICLHAFCNRCITEWTTINQTTNRTSTCPLCRSENNNSDSNDFILIEQDVQSDPLLDYINSILVFIKK